jgi:uncharacterized protein (TIGR02391 family)
MSRTRVLDKSLLYKICRKLGKKDIVKINVMVSKKASNLGISSEAALILLAKELGIGVSAYQRKLAPYKQAEVRDMLPIIFSKKSYKKTAKKYINKNLPYRQPIELSHKARLKAAIEYLIHDPELEARCNDLLLRPSRFDRAINQATQVLEDRIRQKASFQGRLVGIALVNYAFNNDLTKTILKISDNPDEQNGFVNILRGVMLAFRNPTHHYVKNTLTREEAMQICGFIDVLLKVIGRAIKIG